MGFYEIMTHAHSGFRYVTLVLLVAAIVNAIMGWTKSANYGSGSKKLNLFAMVAMHIQVLIGIILYFISPRVAMAMGDFGAAMKDADLRFFGLEHGTAMVIAMVLITIGRKRAEKLRVDQRRHKRIALTYLIALIIIFVSIPWPFFNRLSFDVTWF